MKLSDADFSCPVTSWTGVEDSPAPMNEISEGDPLSSLVDLVGEPWSGAPSISPGESGPQWSSDDRGKYLLCIVGVPLKAAYVLAGPCWIPCNKSGCKLGESRFVLLILERMGIGSSTLSMSGLGLKYPLSRLSYLLTVSSALCSVFSSGFVTNPCESIGKKAQVFLSLTQFWQRPSGSSLAVMHLIFRRRQ